MRSHKSAIKALLKVIVKEGSCRDLLENVKTDINVRINFYEIETKIKKKKSSQDRKFFPIYQIEWLSNKQISIKNLREMLYIFRWLRSLQQRNYSSMRMISALENQNYNFYLKELKNQGS